jgi:hydroxypyruvate reductase|tara:strand:+ start:2463 stop:3596 length:1134 start_codon:yes stop_codon:yes gene_type:complete
MTTAQRNTLLHLFRAAVSSVKGDISVRNWVSGHDVKRPTHIVAVGKAAAAMFDGLPDDWRNTIPTYLVTKTNHLGDREYGRNVVALETSHPIPDQTSMNAGERLYKFAAKCPAGSHLLMLVSGGASSLVEHLGQGVGLDDLVALTETALAEGLDIDEVNKRRQAISAIKGGRLLATFKGQQVDVLAISDVAGDSISVIGSGIGAPPERIGFTYNCGVVAANAVARDAIVEIAKSLDIKIITNKENLYEDVPMIAARIAQEIKEGPDGLYVYGGEPTVILPGNPGKGGRNQALALEIARHVQNRTDIVGLVAGTDGTDGPTNAAGAFLDGDTFSSEPGAEDALRRADSASFLARTGDQIITGPTGTNVMDLAIFLRHR